jgi:hypothetical protein
MKRLILIPFMVLACFFFGRAVDAQTDPAIPACDQAVAAGYYTVDLYSQCLDDYHEVNQP